MIRGELTVSSHPNGPDSGPPTAFFPAFLPPFPQGRPHAAPIHKLLVLFCSVFCLLCVLWTKPSTKPCLTGATSRVPLVTMTDTQYKWKKAGFQYSSKSLTARLTCFSPAWVLPKKRRDQIASANLGVVISSQRTRDTYPKERQ